MEMLVVLALAGLATGWLLQARPSRVAAAAVALRTQLLQARFESIERNAPVAVVYRAQEDSFLTLAAQPLAFDDPCATGEEVKRLRLAEYRGVRVTRVPSSGLVWLPNGTGRTCDGGGAFNQTIALADSVREARVIVSRAGRVRSEVDR